MRPLWFKSTFSGSDKTCVEVSHCDGAVLIRDSKYTGAAAEQPIISVPAVQWPAVLELVLSADSGDIAGTSITVRADGTASLTREGMTLDYTVAEWDAFMKGVADGQFTRL
ncbi:DUF397 domain-containing protein [Nocardia brevicatena]|uniref:DUF397 domain-containing protein n=1 Tax=Nocardia brevicatena TaxID=37327 RepID=UPI00059296F6|nr:DUF397 domain-containing protein [Nocardia brevicatena]